MDHRAAFRLRCVSESRVLVRRVSAQSRRGTRRLARVDCALVRRERNPRRTGNACRRPIAAKSESQLPDRAHALGRGKRTNRGCRFVRRKSNRRVCASLQRLTISMKITLVGAAGSEVTGSCYVIETKQARILVDCGLFQGGKKSEALNCPPTTPNRKLDAVLLTHGHLDHTGRLPLLAKIGYTGRILGTPATLDMTGLILRDSA